MLVNTTKTEVKEDDYYRSPKATFDDYLENFISVMAEVFKVYFLISEVDFYYDPAKVRGAFMHENIKKSPSIRNEIFLVWSS